MTDPELSALRERAEKGDADAVDELIETAGERGDMDELRRLADGGNADAADQLIELAGSVATWTSCVVSPIAGTRPRPTS